MLTSTKISSVIITLNEQDHISSCIESIYSISDEIIVVDSFSTDNTEAICKKFDKVRFIKHSFEGYGQQKQFAVDAASYDIVLSIDADETLSEKAVSHIQSLKENGFDNGAYIILRYNFMMGKVIRHGNAKCERILRLFNRKTAAFLEMKVHETVHTDVEVGTIDGYMLHHTYKDMHSYIEKTNKYTTLWAEDKFENGKRTSLLSVVTKMSLSFFVSYYLKLGFLDGYPGFLWCRTNAFYSYLKYAKLYELQNK